LKYYGNFHIQINGYSLPKPQRITQEEWIKNWGFPFIWTSRTRTSEFTQYFSQIKDGEDPRAVYLKSVLEF